MEGIVGLMIIAGYLALEATSFTVHALSYGAQGAFYVADQAQRAVGAGPSVTTFEVELIAPAAAPAGEREMFACARPSSDIPSGERIHCLNRSYFTSFAGFAEPDGSSSAWRFQVAVYDAPASVCLDFYDQPEVGRGSWFIAGSDPRYGNSLAALPTVTSRRPPLGTFCLSGVPSPGAVTVGGLSCPAGNPSACESAAVAMVPK